LAERPTIVSFWVLRPEEHPEAEDRDYPRMLQILQRSCDRLGLRHIVLTDFDTAASDNWPEGIQSWSTELPLPLMQAATEAHAQYLGQSRTTTDTVFVGADCIMIDDPSRRYPMEPDLCVTSRPPTSRLDAINNGAMLVRRRAIDSAAALYRRVADRCGTAWCDDQKALVAELSPVPHRPRTVQRAGLMVGFLPMTPFNQAPRWAGDPCTGAVMLHFSGHRRKRMLFAWAKHHGFA